MIDATDIAIAEYIIDESRAVETLVGSFNRSHRGRKTNTNLYRLYLVGALLTLQERRTFVLQDILRTLTEALPPEDQFRLGVRSWHTPKNGTAVVKVLTISDLYNVSRVLSDRLGYGASRDDIDDDERQRRRLVVQQYSDDIMDVFDLGFESTTYAIDASGIWGWEIGRGKKPDPPETDEGNPAHGA